MICPNCKKNPVLKAAGSGLCMSCARKQGICVYCGCETENTICVNCTPAQGGGRFTESETAKRRRLIESYGLY